MHEAFIDICAYQSLIALDKLSAGFGDALPYK